MSYVALVPRHTTFEATLQTTHDIPAHQATFTAIFRASPLYHDSATLLYSIVVRRIACRGKYRVSYRMSCVVSRVALEYRVSYGVSFRMSCVAVQERRTTFNMALTGFRTLPILRFYSCLSNLLRSSTICLKQILSKKINSQSFQMYC